MKRLFAPALLLAACACGRDAGGRAAADSSAARDARKIPAVAFRMPRRGGTIEVYQLPALASTSWSTGGRVGGARAAIGVDLFGRRLLYRDSAGGVAAFDLVSLRERRIASPRALAAVGADGTLLAVDGGGEITESQPWGTRTWPGSLGRGVRAIFAAPGPRLLAVRAAGGDSLQVASRETGLNSSHPVPDAPARAATRDGDAVAFALEDGIEVFEDRRMDEPWTVRVGGSSHALVFSPSGHRLYAALAAKPEIVVVDRFSHDVRSRIHIPAPATDLRMDPWGRALLAHGGDGDSAETWVVSLADEDVTGRFRSAWATDLPVVSEDGVLLLREGNAVVARDVRSLDSLSAVPNAAGDLWLTGRWAPASAAAAARAQATAAASAQPPVTMAPTTAARAAPSTSTPIATPAPSPAPGAARGDEALSAPIGVTRAPAKEPAPAAAAPASTFFVQLSATRNESAARALVGVIQQEQHQAEAVPPVPGDDMWRVMSGPFRSREAADSAGRSMGRAYWVVERTPGQRP